MMRYVLCFLLLMLAVNLTAVSSPFEAMADTCSNEIRHIPITTSLHFERAYMSRPLSVGLVDGELHVVWREYSKTMLLCIPPRPSPDRVWKDVYGAVDGAVVLVRTVKGKHVPASTRPEQFLFPEEE